MCYHKYRAKNGLVAQLGERRVRNAEVMGSNPTRSTNKKATFVSRQRWLF